MVAVKENPGKTKNLVESIHTVRILSMRIVQPFFKKFQFIPLSALLLVLSGCATAPPKNANNVCDIFKENRSWYKAAAATRDKWGVPIGIPMSFMYQESSFRHNAKPPMRYFLGVVPYGRASSAYGYSQAKTPTWNDYVNDTGRRFASRSNFADAMDFIGWYIDKTNQVNRVPKNDAYRLYLNYHEGWGGYRRGSYRSKAWLQTTARQVDLRAQLYQQQLVSCEQQLQRGWFRRLLFG